MIRRHSEQLAQEIKLDLENYGTLSDKDKEIVLSRIDQKISDLCVSLFHDMHRQYDDLQRLARDVKRIVREALVKEYKNPTDTFLHILGGVASIGGGIAGGTGLFLGGPTGNMLAKVGKLTTSSSQGFSLIGKVTENFSQADKIIDQDEMDTAKNQISNDEEGKRESRQTYNKIIQNKKDQNAQDHSAKREILGR